MEEKLHRRWVKIGGKKGSIFNGNFHQTEVFEYVMKNKHKMPRTALRYAIELMPKQLKKKAMEK